MLALLVVVALVGAGIYAVYFSSWLAVAGIDVTGADTVSATEVRVVAAVSTGGPLATVDLAAIRARVESLAPVRSADVSREWPDRVRVAITERVAVAVVEIGGQLRAMDSEGVAFRDLRSAPPGLPRVVPTSGASATVLHEAATVVSALPADLAGRVDHLEVRSEDEVTLVLRSGSLVVWGSSEDSDDKARVLQVLLGRQAATYDVSVPGRPTTR